MKFFRQKIISGRFFPEKNIPQKIIAGLILTSFATVIFFSIPFMMHGSDSQMGGGCLFPSAGTALCPQTDFGSAIHHLTSFQSFLNVTTNQGMQGLIALMFFLSFVALVLVTFRASSWASPPLLKVAGHSHSRDLSPTIPFKEKETAWLSLLENSPSYI